MATRLAKVIQNIVHESQKCVPGRRIIENIHLVQDLIDAIVKGDFAAAFILLDQEKAFDRISHKFMIKTLRTFGFGENFIKWVEIIYRDVNSRVKVNGFLTEEIKINRGVRQGCALSALLYVLCAEVLTTNIRKNKLIKGFSFENDDYEHKDATYADDMNICVTTDESITELFKTLDKYEQATNSKINRDKTVCQWLGAWKNRTDKPLGLNWTSNAVMFLGVYIGNDRKEASTATFSDINDSIKGEISY